MSGRSVTHCCTADSARARTTCKSGKCSHRKPPFEIVFNSVFQPSPKATASTLVLSILLAVDGQTSLRLRRASRTLQIHTCILTRRDTARLQHSLPLYLNAACTHRADRASELHTSTSLRLQRDSRPAQLYTSISTRLQRAARPPEAHTSTSRHLQRAPAASELRTSMSANLQRTSTPPELHTSTSLLLHRASRPPNL